MIRIIMIGLPQSNVNLFLFVQIYKINGQRHTIISINLMKSGARERRSGAVESGKKHCKIDNSNV